MTIATEGLFAFMLVRLTVVRSVLRRRNRLLSHNLVIVSCCALALRDLETRVVFLRRLRRKGMRKKIFIDTVFVAIVVSVVVTLLNFIFVFVRMLVVVIRTFFLTMEI